MQYGQHPDCESGVSGFEARQSPLSVLHILAMDTN
jgi:hypothetical protein